MRFTFLEWEILKHRLEADDAIAEVFHDDNVFDDMTFDELRDRVTNLLDRGNKAFNGKVTHIPAVSVIDMVILREAAEGSTIFGSMDDAVATGEISRDQRKRFHNAADVLESMLQVTIPRA